MRSDKRFVLGMSWLACIAIPFSAAGQSYPAKPIRVISASSLGSGGDISLRLLAPKMGAGLGQPVIVETRTGAGGAIAAREVTRSGPDGYTILYTSNMIVAAKFLVKEISYDLMSDLVPIKCRVISWFTNRSLRTRPES